MNLLKILGKIIGSVPGKAVGKEVATMARKPALRSIQNLPGIARGGEATRGLLARHLGRSVTREEISKIAGVRVKEVSSFFGSDITKMSREEVLKIHAAKGWKGTKAPGINRLDVADAANDVEEMLRQVETKTRQMGMTSEGLHITPSIAGRAPMMSFIQGGRVRAFGTTELMTGGKLKRGTIAVGAELRGTDVGATISQTMTMMGAVESSSLSTSAMAAYHKNILKIAQMVEVDTAVAMRRVNAAQTMSTVNGMHSSLGANRGIRSGRMGGAG